MSRGSGLAVRTKTRATWSGVVGLAFVSMAIYETVSIVTRLAGDAPIEGFRFALVGIGLVGLVVSQKL